uniref:Uncharacterized protein n=1 Tax=Arundo donax TaxID=35708 RepID=A0A0A9BRY2_ARUDO
MPKCFTGNAYDITVSLACYMCLLAFGGRTRVFHFASGSKMI